MWIKDSLEFIDKVKGCVVEIVEKSHVNKILAVGQCVLNRGLQYESI